MSMTLPSELVWVLDMIGITWPDSDEDKLEAMGNAWEEFGQKLRTFVDDADKHAQGVWGDNTGEAIDAFKTSWSGSEAPAASLREGADAAAMIAEGLFIASKVVVGLKVKVIAECGFLAYTIAAATAAAFETGGLSLLAIPAARWAAKRAIEELINRIIAELLSG
jgi:hypothetical protein